MRFSIWPAAAQPFPHVLAIARHAAATGWHGVWIADHFMPNDGTGRPPLTPTLEASSTIAALAAAVDRVRLGTLVYGNTYRHPAVVANMAATVDRISDGRFTLGLGAGWQENEHRQYGIPLPPVGERIDRLEEALQVIRGLLTQERTTFAGEHYRLVDAVCEPKPVQPRLPLLVGASGERRMLPLVARHADAWNCWGLPEEIGRKSALIDEHCAALGRDPAEITRTAQALVIVTPDAATADERVARAPMPAYGGPADRLAEVVAAYADAGVDELIVPTAGMGDLPQVLDTMDLLTSEVFTVLT